jgi:hypothetical protein
MSIMLAQTTRLELTIVAAALLVLLLCSQPPRSGNADVRMDVPPTSLETETSAAQPDENGSTPVDPPITEPGSQVLNPGRAEDLPLHLPSPDNTTAGRTMPGQPKVRRIGVVDARNCDGLRYKDVMYGEVTVKMVWDGQRFVFRKVCEVREKNGVVSVWSFDKHDDIVLSEIQQQVP